MTKRWAQHLVYRETHQEVGRIRLPRRRPRRPRRQQKGSQNVIFDMLQKHAWAPWCAQVRWMKHIPASCFNYHTCTTNWCCYNNYYYIDIPFTCTWDKCVAIYHGQFLYQVNRDLIQRMAPHISPLIFSRARWWPDFHSIVHVDHAMLRLFSGLLQKELWRGWLHHPPAAVVVVVVWKNVCSLQPLCVWPRERFSRAERIALAQIRSSSLSGPNPWLSTLLTLRTILIDITIL